MGEQPSPKGLFSYFPCARSTGTHNNVKTRFPRQSTADSGLSTWPEEGTGGTSLFRREKIT